MNYPLKNQTPHHNSSDTSSFGNLTWAILFSLAVFSTTHITAHAQEAPLPNPTLTIGARLFGSSTGTLSADIIASGQTLHNTPAASDFPAESVLVTVRTNGIINNVGAARIHLVAKENFDTGVGYPAGHRARWKSIFDSKVSVPGAASSGKSAFVGFFLQKVGCAPVKLRAELTMPEQKSVVAEQMLDFRCFE